MINNTVSKQREEKKRKEPENPSSYVGGTGSIAELQKII